MNFGSIFSPPLSKRDHKKNQEAIIINTTLWSIVTLIALSELGNIIGGRTPLPVRFFNYIFLALTFGYIYLTRKDKSFPVLNILYLALGLIYISAAIFFLGSVGVPTTIAFILPIVLAGYLFGERGSYLFTTLVSVIIFLLISLEKSGQIQAVNPTPSIPQWITYTAFLGVISNIVLVSNNIIRRYWKKAEREILRRKKTEEVLALYSHAIHHSPTSIIITNAKGEIERVNPKFETHTGYMANDAIGQLPFFLESGTHPIAFYEKMQEKILNGEEWQAEMHIRRKTGNLYWAKVSVAPIFDRANKITHFICLMEDITAQKNAEFNEKESKQRLKEQLHEIRALQEKLERQALRDSLTGLHNRHYMDEVLVKEFSRAERGKYPISIILVDLDYLKNINDIGGHATGDYALRSIASQLRTCTRKGDTVCRYGGDEFAIILPNTGPEDALNRAQELKERMKSLTLLFRAEQTLRITFTAGIASYPVHGTTSTEIFNFADVALYRAKLKGRNRVELFSVE